MASNQDDHKPPRYQETDYAGHKLKSIIGRLSHRHIARFGKILGGAAFKVERFSK